MRDGPARAPPRAREESLQSRQPVYVACEFLLCSSLLAHLLCGGGFGGFLFFAPSPRQRVADAVIALVTGMLEHRSVDLHKRHFAFPRSLPRGGVVHGKFVADRIVADAGEALGDVCI